MMCGGLSKSDFMILKLKMKMGCGEKIGGKVRFVLYTVTSGLVSSGGEGTGM